MTAQTSDNSLQNPYILALDCGGTALSLAVAHVEKGVLLQKVEPQQKGGERLPVAVEELLAEADVSLQDIGLICFASGPGSFTGIRVAATFAEGLAQALNVPVVGVPTLPVIAQPHIRDSQPVVVLNEAHGGMVYMQIFAEKQVSEAIALSAEEAFERIPENAIICGDVALKYAEQLAGKGEVIKVPEARYANPSLLAQAGLKVWQDGAGKNRPQLNYVKPLTYKKIAEQGPHERS